MYIPLIYPIDSFLGLCMFKFFLAWFMNLFAYMQAWAYLCTVHVHLQWCILAIPPLSQEPGASQAQFLYTSRSPHTPGLLRLARGCSPMCFWSLCAWVVGCTHSVSHTRLEKHSPVPVGFYFHNSPLKRRWKRGLHCFSCSIIRCLS